MVTFTKTQLLEYYAEMNKIPPDWVFDAPEDALFSQGWTRGGHVPLHIQGSVKPPAIKGILSIDPP